MLKISKGNSKIGNTLNFSISPVTTCIGQCEGKNGSCYALKMCKRYPNVRRCYDNNYIETLKDSFVNDFKKVFDFMTLDVQFKYFRIHVAGDFYSQEYLNKWFEICKSYPKVKFLAFTKSFMLDFTQKPKNMIVINSVWNDNYRSIKNTFRQSHVIDKKDSILHDSNFMKNKLVCGGNCSTCRSCWTSKKDIIFIKH